MLTEMLRGSMGILSQDDDINNLTKIEGKRNHAPYNLAT